MTDTVEIQIPEELASKLSSRASKTQHNELSEYIIFVLNEVYNEMNVDEGAEIGVDSDQVEDRLKSLGYLDK